MKYEVEVVRSKRKTLSIEIKSDLRVLVRAPLRMKKSDIQRFVNEKDAWIQKHLEIAEQRRLQIEPPFTEEQIRELTAAAKRDIPQRVAKYAPLIGVTVGRVSIRKQKSRWGSCSSKGNVNFNCLLMLCPQEVRDYVVIHELCHRLHMNHSAKFWAEVEKYMPHYAQNRRWLKENGSQLIQRIR